MADKQRFYEGGAGGARRSAPAALRNREPIAGVLEEWLPTKGRVLEIASGSGEHAIYFADCFPNLDWQPTDVDPGALDSIAAWRDEAGQSNLLSPVRLDAASAAWPVESADAIFSANMVHISPWESAIGLIDGASRILAPGGALILYGPWLADDIEPAASNLEFDADLKRRDPRWGLRRVEDFAAAAAERSLALVDRRAMPANNLMLLLKKDPGPR